MRISVFDGIDATINNNRINNGTNFFGAGDDGIHVERNNGFMITNNTVEDPGGFDSVGDDGIFR